MPPLELFWGLKFIATGDMASPGVGSPPLAACSAGKVARLPPKLAGSKARKRVRSAVRRGVTNCLVESKGHAPSHSGGSVKDSTQPQNRNLGIWQKGGFHHFW